MVGLKLGLKLEFQWVEAQRVEWKQTKDMFKQKPFLKLAPVQALNSVPEQNKKFNQLKNYCTAILMIIVYVLCGFLGLYKIFLKMNWFSWNLLFRYKSAISPGIFFLFFILRVIIPKKQPKIWKIKISQTRL